MALSKAVYVASAVLLLFSVAPTDATDPAGVLTLSYKGCLYKMFDTGATMMKTWQDAAQYCYANGYELVPYDNADGHSAVKELCSRNRFTCWFGGKKDWETLCPLISAEGTLLKQGCGQVVRFVCRKPELVAPPSPVPNPVVNSGVACVTYAGYDYRMYTTDAGMMKTWKDACDYCVALGAGWELVPYDHVEGYAAVKKLCSDSSYTCWFNTKDSDSLCPLISAGGDLLKQGCGQVVRFVCRKKL